VEWQKKKKRWVHNLPCCAASESLLSRSLTQRAPLARALPLLVAFAPEAFRFRSLHVFAKTTASHDEFSEVTVGDGADAGDLKKSIIAELKLDAAPNRVRLLREVEGGGAPVPLDSRRALAEQGVLDGCSLFVEVSSPPSVLARRSGSLNPIKVALAPGADAGDLAKAVIAELKLDAAPNRVRLLREVEGGGAPVPLDSRKALAEQGVHEGSSVLIEVLPSPTPPLPPALPQLTLDANPAATPHVEYRGALGRGWGTSTFLRCALTPSSCLLPCAPTPPSSFRPFAQH
jgi:hypothetical protein